jgi:hypothetical protein
MCRWEDNMKIGFIQVYSTYLTAPVCELEEHGIFSE